MEGSLIKKFATALLALTVTFGVVAVADTTSRALGDIEINETNFPDPAFRLYVSEKFDNNPKDNRFSQAEIDNAKNISVLNCKMSSLKGIEFFTSLEKIETSHGRFKELDLSQNTKLKVVSSHNGVLEKIDLSGCKDIERVILYQNRLVSLDLSDKKELVEVDCKNNALTSVNVTGATSLETLELFKNKLTEIDVSSNRSLKILDFGHNDIVDIDIRNNSNLTELWTDNNPIGSVDISRNSHITDVYQNGKLIDQVLEADDGSKDFHVYQKDQMRFSVDASVAVSTGANAAADDLKAATFLDYVRIYLDKVLTVSLIMPYIGTTSGSGLIW
jgi:hypothetical protein